MLRIEENGLNAEIYTELRAHAGMQPYKREDVEIALGGTLFSVVVWDDDKPIGIARVVGDGRVSFLIKDVVVHPDFQGRGIGRLVMEKIMAYVQRAGAANAYVGLMSTPGKEGFYEQFGFHVRPCENEGSGMTCYINCENTQP